MKSQPQALSTSSEPGASSFIRPQNPKGRVPPIPEGSLVHTPVLLHWHTTVSKPSSGAGTVIYPVSLPNGIYHLLSTSFKIRVIPRQKPVFEEKVKRINSTRSFLKLLLMTTSMCSFLNYMALWPSLLALLTCQQLDHSAKLQVLGPETNLTHWSQA